MDLLSSLLSLYGGLCYVFYACSTLISSLGVDVSGSRPYRVAYHNCVTPFMSVEDSFPLPGFLPENGTSVFSDHVPRINGEIPSADETISDHQRLLERVI